MAEKRVWNARGECEYNLALNNCEQFVAWCIMGIGYSDQINTAVSAVIQTKALLEMPAIQSVAGCIAQSAFVEHTARQVTTAVVPTSVALATSSALSGSSVAIATGLSIASVTPLAAPIAAGVIVGYGVKKLIDWVW